MVLTTISDLATFFFFYRFIVETEDEFSKARLSGCSRGSVTVKFNFKYIRLEKIMGIRAELICDNGRTVSSMKHVE